MIELRRGRLAAVVAVPLLLILALTSCGRADDAADADLLRGARLEVQVPFTGSSGRSDDAATARLVEASQRLAVDLVTAADGDDVVVSPLGLQLVLAVLREGADGPVAEEIDLVAGLDGSQAVADLRVRMEVWAGDVSAVDREAPPEQPGGRPEPAPETVVRLMNAIVLAASWATEFDPAATSDEPFTRPDGSVVEVPTMHLLQALPHAAADGWQALELPYTEGFSMRIVVADDGRPVDADRWARADAGLDSDTRPHVRLAMPRWETDSTLQLGQLLPDLGLGSLRAPAGGLDGVVPGAFVSDVAQAGTITVGERGTVAAVVTDLALAGSMPPEPEVELSLDRPFDYRVVEDATGLVLIAGRVADPS